jgi:hypothetical protein
MMEMQRTIQQGVDWGKRLGEATVGGLHPARESSLPWVGHLFDSGETLALV